MTKLNVDEVIVETTTPNLNDPKSVEAYFTKTSNAMIEHDETQVKAVGIMLKHVAVGFVAALEAAKRQDIGCGTQVQSLANVFAQILGVTTLGLTEDKDKIKIACACLSQVFVEAYTKFVADAIGDPSFAFGNFRERSKATHGKSALGALGYMPDNGTRH